MRIGPFELRPRRPPSLLLSLAAVFIALGVWQLYLAHETAALKQTLQARAAMPPMKIKSFIEDPEGLRYRHIEVRGHYIPAGQLYIEGCRHEGRAGMHVITPLAEEGSTRVMLVNRGWIPANADGTPTDAPMPKGPIYLRGEAQIPSSPALDGGPEAAKTWGDRWPYLTVPLYQSRSDLAVQPVMLLLDPDQPGGLVCDRQRPMPNPWTHLGYAAQWLALALIAVLIRGRLNLHRPAPEDSRPEASDPRPPPRPGKLPHTGHCGQMHDQKERPQT